MAPNHSLRFRHLVAAVAGLAVLTASACSGTTAVADVTPDVETACSAASEELVALIGREPSRDATSIAVDALFVIFQGMPDVDTDLGRPRTLLGDEVQAMRSRLLSVQTAARQGDPTFDAVEVEREIRAAFADLNDAAAQFEVTQCLETDILESAIIPQLSRVAVAVEAAAPTGDYEVDIDAVCDRFRVRETQVLLDNATSDFANALLVDRLRGLGTDLATEVERLEPPADRQANVDALLSTLDDFDDSLAAAQSAQFQSQEALDAAIERFDVVNARLVDRLEAFNPGC